MLSFLLGKYLGAEWLNQMIALCLLNIIKTLFAQQSEYT